MTGLTATRIVEIWERGQHQHPVERALTMLAPACPDLTSAELALWTIGQRDHRLMQLRRQTWGDRLEAFTRCPECDEALEIPLSIQVLCERLPNEPAESLELISEGYKVRYRLPTSHDLVAVSGSRDMQSARNALLKRCTVNVQHPSELAVDDALPEEIAAAVTAGIADNDPAADIQLSLDCPECAARWTTRLDIAQFFWREICQAAKHLLGQVHQLASAYGWTESEVLSLGAKRRQYYLGLIQ